MWVGRGGSRSHQGKLSREPVWLSDIWNVCQFGSGVLGSGWGGAADPDSEAVRGIDRAHGGCKYRGCRD